MKWNVTEFSIEVGKGKLKEAKVIKIYHNLKTKGPINTIEAAVDNWSARTNNPCAEDLCDYINSKRLKGMTLDYAYTEEQLRQINELEGSALVNYKHNLKKKNSYL